MLLLNLDDEGLGATAMTPAVRKLRPLPQRGPWESFAYAVKQGARQRGPAGLDAAALPSDGGYSSDCQFVDANGQCVKAGEPSTGGGGYIPRRNLYSGMYQMQPVATANYRPPEAPPFVIEPGPIPTVQTETTEPVVTVDASTEPGKQVTVTVPADQAGQIYPGYAKFRIPRWALILGGISALGLVIAALVRR